MLTSRKKLILVGGGGFTPEVLDLVAEIPLERRDWELLGVVDDHPQDVAERFRRLGIKTPVLGGIQRWEVEADQVFAMAIGGPKPKLMVAEKLAAKGAEFRTLIHPTAACGSGSKLGAGVIMCRHAVVTTGVQVGDHVHLNVAASVGHDAIIGDGCTLSGHCDVTGYAVLGRGVFLGSHAAVSPKVNVGDFARIAAGSVAFRNVAEGQTIIGVPGKWLI